MRAHPVIWFAIIHTCGLSACSGSGGASHGPGDAAGVDAASPDAARVDAASPDAARDARAMDAVADGALPGFGTLTGSCGVLTREALTSESSMVLSNVLDFGTDPYDDPADRPRLSAGGQEILLEGNLGGSSLYSEVFAFEALSRCEQAQLIKTEKEIAYLDPAGKKTDLYVAIDGLFIGVSVVRAFKYPGTEPCDGATIRACIEDKLADIQRSTLNTHPSNSWEKQILSVLAHGEALCGKVTREQIGLIDSAVLKDTLIVVTVTEGADDPLYLNPT